jgi:hypothetical protein
LFFGLGAAVCAVVGLAPYLYAPLGLVLSFAVAIRLRIERLGPSPLGIAALLALVAMYALQAVFRSGFGVESAARSGYLYPAAIFLWLAAGDVLRRPRRLAPGRPMIVAATICIAIVVVANLTQLLGSGRAMRGLRVSEVAELELISANRGLPGMALDATPDEELIPQVTARRYLAAIARFGEPRIADPPDEDEAAVLVDAGRLNRAALALFASAFGGTAVEAPTGPSGIALRSGSVTPARPGCVVAGDSGPTDVTWVVDPGDGFAASPPPAVLLLGVRPTDLQRAPSRVRTTDGPTDVVLPPALADGARWFVLIEIATPTTICRLVRA